MLQTHAATTSVFAWLAVYAPPGAQTPSALRTTRSNSRSGNRP